MLFIEETSPPPFYQEQLSAAERTQLDKWFIGERSQAYYLKRFAQFDEQGYLSPKWNWAAFFATFGWLLYRKRYLDSIVYSVAGWSFIQLNITIILVAFQYLLMPYVPSAYQMMTRLIIAGVIWLFWAVMVARWSDAYYYRMARREIADVVEFYPKDPQRQKAHLTREGGVSQIGLALAFGLFVFVLLVIQIQFLPIYAKPERVYIIQNVSEWLHSTAYQVEAKYRQEGKCPVSRHIENSDLHVRMDITTTSEAVINPNSPCIITATIIDVPFPNRNLNNHTIILYRESSADNARWFCTTSLNQKIKPINCIEE